MSLYYYKMDLCWSLVLPVALVGLGLVLILAYDSASVFKSFKKLYIMHIGICRLRKLLYDPYIRYKIYIYGTHTPIPSMRSA